jgi:hypothetical protein
MNAAKLSAQIVALLRKHDALALTNHKYFIAMKGGKIRPEPEEK